MIALGTTIEAVPLEGAEPAIREPRVTITRAEQIPIAREIVQAGRWRVIAAENTEPKGE